MADPSIPPGASSAAAQPGLNPAALSTGQTPGSLGVTPAMPSGTTLSSTPLLPDVTPSTLNSQLSDQDPFVGERPIPGSPISGSDISSMPSMYDEYEDAPEQPIPNPTPPPIFMPLSTYYVIREHVPVYDTPTPIPRPERYLPPRPPGQQLPLPGPLVAVPNQPMPIPPVTVSSDEPMPDAPMPDAPMPDAPMLDPSEDGGQAPVPPDPPGPDQFGGAGDVEFPLDDPDPWQGEEYDEDYDEEEDDQMREIRIFSERAAEELRGLFSTSTLWELEKVLGNGAFGITVLLRDRSPFRRSRRVVLKRSIREEEHKYILVREIEALQDMRGHAHIGQLKNSIVDVAYTRPRRGRLARIARRILGLASNSTENIFKILSTKRGPAIILEYLENGSLAQLQAKATEKGVELPNRILWSWYFCLMRACVAMTHQKEGFTGGLLELELLSNARGKYYPLQHGDIYARNLMIANREPWVPEHQTVPKLSLIDFGSTKFVATPYQAELENMSMASRVVLNLVLVDLRLSGSEIVMNFNGIETRAGMILPGPDGVEKYPRLDPALRDLLVRALNVNKGQRPGLPELFAATRAGMKKGEDDYPGNPQETDANVRRVLQDLLHDA
ncbi:hypothetical protein F4803DRAFT_546733 [Xylaria telfairii]|nr:hypothetical protein F4803DRAFT_546733 [Xylaria telfairii]